ncbi:MAG TPA: YciI family protein [Actinomycetota bacterium]|nr:YciI family protein [Actinomycetota bacterium]
MAEFMIFMRENDDAWAKMPPERQQELMKGYFAWVDDLRKRDIMRGGNALNNQARLLRLVDGEVVDGPFTETKEVLTGYFVIEADSFEAAVDIAKGCPALFHGETVELRMVGH